MPDLINKFDSNIVSNLRYRLGNSSNSYSAAWLEHCYNDLSISEDFEDWQNGDDRPMHGRLQQR